jgi:hypothetical protein
MIAAVSRRSTRLPLIKDLLRTCAEPVPPFTSTALTPAGLTYFDVCAGGYMELKIIGLTIVLAVLTGLFVRLVDRLQVKK